MFLFYKGKYKKLFSFVLCLKSSLSTNKKWERNIRNFLFSGFSSSLLEYKSILRLGLESSVSWNIRQFFRVNFFHFTIRESFLLKYKKKYQVRNFHFSKFKKFFNLGARKFHFLKYKKLFQGGFFLAFWAWA